MSTINFQFSNYFLAYIKYLRVDVGDEKSTSIEKHFEEIYKFIHDALIPEDLLNETTDIEEVDEENFNEEDTRAERGSGCQVDLFFNARVSDISDERSHMSL